MNTISKTGIWGPEEAVESSYPRNETLPLKLTVAFRPGQVVRDFGCGDGYYISELKKVGFTVFGYDGHIPESSLIPERCHAMDLTKDMPLIVNAGNVLCLEVGEHIPADLEDVFLDNLVKACRERMVLSWAIEGQGGLGHVNCRSNGYVIGKMADRGFTLNHELTDMMRTSTPMHVRYFAQTLMVFDKIQTP
jgi:tryptophanyl-tRNA synthetase